MNQQQQHAIACYETLLESLAVLKSHLGQNDDNAAHEAISVLLMQTGDLFGTQSVVMQQFFPVMDTIKQRIDAMQLQDALRQAELFDSQIREIQTIIANC